jgi:hypothetical protein
MSETPELPSQNLSDVKRILEAALLSSQDALTTGDMKRLFVDELDPTLIRRVLDELREDWTGRGIELVQVASGWRFRTRAEMQPYLERLKNEKPPRIRGRCSKRWRSLRTASLLQEVISRTSGGFRCLRASSRRSKGAAG